MRGEYLVTVANNRVKFKATAQPAKRPFLSLSISSTS